jgi:hypothetical protein
VAKTPNTNFLDLKIDLGSARQCHSSAHFVVCARSNWREKPESMVSFAETLHAILRSAGKHR